MDVNANLCKSERNFTIDVRAGQVKIDFVLITAAFWSRLMTELLLVKEAISVKLTVKNTCFSFYL